MGCATRPKVGWPGASIGANSSSRGMSAREAADIIWTLASERTFLALVRDRRWKTENYERWVAEQLVAALLAQQ